MLIPSITVFFFTQLTLPHLTAAISPFQPERTDPSRQGYQIDGWTPKPTSSPELLIQERQSYGNQVCGVLRGNLGTIAANLTQIIRTTHTLAKPARHVCWKIIGGDVAFKLIPKAAISGNVPQSRHAWDIRNSVSVTRLV